MILPIQSEEGARQSVLTYTRFSKLKMAFLAKNSYLQAKNTKSEKFDDLNLQNLLNENLRQFVSEIEPGESCKQQRTELHGKDWERLMSRSGCKKVKKEEKHDLRGLLVTTDMLSKSVWLQEIHDRLEKDSMCTGRSLQLILEGANNPRLLKGQKYYAVFSLCELTSWGEGNSLSQTTLP